MHGKYANIGNLFIVVRTLEFKQFQSYVKANV